VAESTEVELVHDVAERTGFELYVLNQEQARRATQQLSPVAQAILGFDEHHVVFFQHREKLVLQLLLP
jgi:hypothetical protein